MPAPQKLPSGGCDAISQHLRAIGRVPLLTPDEEISLGRAVQSGRRLLELAEEMKMRAGDVAPSLEAWALEAGLDVRHLRRRLRLAERAQARMVTANLRLVVSVARKYAYRQLELEDLIQEGTLGLIRAVERFDPTRGYKLSTYAYWWIREGISRALTDKGRTIRLPVHVGETLSRLRRAQHSLWQQLGRAPSVEELAQATDLKPLDIRETLFRAQQPVSLDAGLAGYDDGNLMDLQRCGAPLPDDRLSRELLSHDLEQLLQQLPDREAELLRLRYGINRPAPMTLSAAARDMGVTRDTARGIERRAVAAVKDLSERVIDYLEA